jgi:putative tryptophan/tyrosine transport system substrate-binding protein
MNRRAFIAGLGGAAAWPLVAKAQLRPVVGFLASASESDTTKLVGAFREGLSQLGFVEGRNVAIEYSWADYHYNRLAELATDLVDRRVDVIAVTPPDCGCLGSEGRHPDNSNCVRHGC